MPSTVFQQIWDEIERLRDKKGLEPAFVAEKSGFKRSTWYVYKRKGNIPFHLLERVAGQVDGKLEAKVVGLSSVRNATKRPPARQAQEGDMDQLEQFQELLDRYPEGEQRTMAFALMYAGAQDYLGKLPPFEETVTAKGASRDRKK